MQTFLSILRSAVEAGASDIHLKPDSPIVFRVSRDLVPVDGHVPKQDWLNSILQQIVPKHLQTRLAEDRETDFAYSSPGLGRFRVNVFQQRGVYVVSMRLVKEMVRDFAELNLPAVIQRVTEVPRGIVLICGATGSGKSTTLAAMIEHINLFSRRHIITLEDPIEYLFTDKQSVIEQREVGLDTATFATGLRNVLRQDPDVLMIGEMRDASSISAAISAANIGHLVISTLHTSDAAKSVQRILDFFPAADRDQARRQLATTLHAVICQKLIPSSTDTLVPAVEVMINTASVTKLIHADQLDKLGGVIEMGGGDGMQTFEIALYDLVKAGRITNAEALLHAPNPEALKMRFQGVVLSEHRRILGSRE
jgi:twitching motility protein PilT